MKIASPRWLAAIFLCLLMGACEVENTNSVTCVAKDCQASCLQSGYLGGACAADDHCSCMAGNTDPYSWTPPTTDLDGGDASLPAGGAGGGVGAP